LDRFGILPNDVKCPVLPFETQIVPNKNTNMHDIGLGPSLVSSQASSIGCLLDVLVHYVLELATQPGSHGQEEKLFQACLHMVFDRGKFKLLEC